MTKGDVHTVWDKDDGVWKNKVEGGQRASSTASTKAEAQAKGRELARKRGGEHHVHNQDGKVSARNSFGKDPERRRG